MKSKKTKACLTKGESMHIHLIYGKWVRLCLVALCILSFHSEVVIANTTKTGISSTVEAGLSLADVPDYSGYSVVVINGNKTYFKASELKTKAFEKYSRQDSLKRCGVAYANICKELMPTQERGEIGSVRPSGWHTVKYNEIIEGNYLYNRCHLIGYQLAGENANEKNLITGTRWLNVNGMLPFENAVAEYVESTGNHVLYRVTPFYEGSNLVASGVEMEAESVEDCGKSICFNIFVYNIQPGITIDYKTGDSQETTDPQKEVEAADTCQEILESRLSEIISGKDVELSSETERITDNDTSKDDAVPVTYILNTKTKKFHRPDCKSVSKMKEKNKKSDNGSRKELISRGYSPCRICDP